MQLSEREKDALAAEKVLGWKHCTYNDTHTWLVGDDAIAVGMLQVPHFGAYAVDARLLEDEIERRGMKYRYINLLSGSVDEGSVNLNERTGQEYDDPEATNGPLPLDGDSLWRLIRATPAQRRDAALRAVGVEV